MILNIQVFKGIFRWKFLWATNNISYASLLPSFCNWLSAFISELDKWLYMLTIQVAWIGLRTESRRSTSTSSRTIPESSWLWICAEYQDVNRSFINCFASLLTVKSRGWKKWVVFAGTLRLQYSAMPTWLVCLLAFKYIPNQQCLLCWWKILFFSL